MEDGEFLIFSFTAIGYLHVVLRFAQFHWKIPTISSSCHGEVGGKDKTLGFVVAM